MPVRLGCDIKMHQLRSCSDFGRAPGSAASLLSAIVVAKGCPRAIKALPTFALRWDERSWREQMARDSRHIGTGHVFAVPAR